MPRIKLGNSEYATLDKLPNDCPYCHRSITPVFIQSHNAANHLEVLLACPNRNCGRSFIGIYQNSYGEYFDFRTTNIGTFTSKSFSEEINSISPNFVKIYNEAFFAEQNNLYEICGVGYRKALEFLIKDYSIMNHPEKEEDIKKIFLGKCIELYVTDDKIKAVSKRAAWLGNDETHYVRKWEGKDLSDLKKLIQLTVHWIEMEYLTKSFETEMPE